MTNTLISTDFSVKKVWSQDDNFKPTSVKVRLFRDGADMGDAYEKTLNEGNGWSAKWENLPKFKEGTTLSVYTVQETKLVYGSGAAAVEKTLAEAGYTSTPNYAVSPATITNTRTKSFTA